jgi:hypothetical protein
MPVTKIEPNQFHQSDTVDCTISYWPATSNSNVDHPASSIVVMQRSDFECNNYQTSGSHPPFAADSGDVASGTKSIIFEWITDSQIGA